MANAPERGWEPDLSRYTEIIFAPYVSLVGQIALAWNDLHEKLAHLFWTLMGGGSMDRPIGVWNSQGFDRARRDLLRAALMAASPRELASHPKLVDDIKWLLDRTGKLENNRNDAVHSPLHVIRNQLIVFLGIVPPVVSDELLQNRRALNLAGKNLIEVFTWTRESILVLRDFAALLDRALAADGAPWPDRPSLPARPHQKSLQQEKAPSPRKARPPRPPPSQP
jgi:hypothetical protein